MRRLPFLALFVLSWVLSSAIYVSAQQQVIVKAVDSGTGLTTNVGDSTNTAIRVSQAGAVWTFNWTLLLGAPPSNANPMPVRLSDGSSYMDGTFSSALNVGIVGGSVIVVGHDFNLGADGTIPINIANATVPVSIPGNNSSTPVYVECVAMTCGATITDGDVFLASNTDFFPNGGVFNDSLADLVSTHQGTTRITKQRAFHVNLRTAAGVEIAPALEAGGNLALIKTDVDKIPSQGQALAAASMPVVLTAIQTTALTPPAAITGFALEAGHLATIDSHTPALGQALAAASVPVILPAATITTLTPPTTVTVTQATGSNLHTVVDSAPTTAVTGTFWQATQPVSGTVTAVQATGTNLHTVVDSAPTTAVTGTFFQATQPVSGTVTANAGTNLNTSLLALEAGGNLATIATNTLAELRPSTATTTNVDASVFETVLLASNASRKSAGLINTSAKILLIKLGTGIGSRNFSYLVQPGASWNLPAPTYTGVVTGIWVGLDGGALVTEM